jgi:vacuolar-type H+-ATPase subunit I/STV1
MAWDREDEGLSNEKIIKFSQDQLNLQKLDLEKETFEQKMIKFYEEKREMLKREKILGEMNLVLKDNSLLSTRSICKEGYFINNFELDLLEQQSQI